MNSDLNNPSPHFPPEALPLLPRSAWSSDVTRLKILFKVKQALDREERVFRDRAHQNAQPRVESDSR